MDGSDVPAEEWCIQCHERLGSLQPVRIADDGERQSTRQAVETEACKLYAVSRLRDGIAALLPGCRFLPPTIIQDGVVVGAILGKRTVLAEGQDFLAACNRVTARLAE